MAAVTAGHTILAPNTELAAGLFDAVELVRWAQTLSQPQASHRSPARGEQFEDRLASLNLIPTELVRRCASSLDSGSPSGA